jgi:DNA-binding SARP family transcriptional activator
VRQNRESIVKVLSPDVKTGYHRRVRTRTFMPEIALRFCSHPSIQNGSEDAGALPAKSLALLAFLALETGPRSREELTALLWGESPEEKASASLRQALSHLRTTFGDRLRIDRTTVELDPGVATDVALFERTVGLDPDAALAIDIPRFLSVLHLKNTPAFEEWLEATQGRLMRKYRRAVIDCAKAAAARREWHRAAELAEKWLQLEPSSEDAAHLLVEARYLDGDETGALGAYSEFRARLEAAEERVPNLALRELVNRIESGRSRVPTPDQNDDWHEVTSHFSVALTGRRREWEVLLKAWSDVRNGLSRFIIVEGESGIGKTRLTDDFARWITTQGGSVLRSRAFEEGQTIPFSVMLEVLRAALNVPGVAGTDPVSLAEVARVVPEIRRRFPSLPQPGPAAGNALLLEAVAEVLMAAAEDHPIAVVIDDFQWCDPDSCTMLHYLVRRLEHSAVFWCATLNPSGLGRDAPAARLVRAIRASPATTRLELGPLGGEQVWSMIRELGHIKEATAGHRFATRVHEVTGGNPFYVIELLKTLLSQGWLSVHPETGEWTVAHRPEGEPDVGTMSPTVQEAIAQRLARLPDDLHAILMSIALSGPGCRTSALSHIHGISRLRAATIGDALVERYFAIEDGGLYRCAHSVIASVVRTEMSTTRRREMHRAIALAMIAVAENGDGSADPGEVAQHAEQGGELRIAYQYALEASQSSRERSAYEEALAWLDLASSCASTPDQTSTVDRATASLLEVAGWPEAPALPRRSGVFALSRGDFDLRGA